MKYKVQFFEFKKDCKEFKTLVKAVSENSTRSQLLEGQQLFDLIYRNIFIIDKYLYNISNVFNNKEVEVTGSEELKHISPHNFEIFFDAENIDNYRINTDEINYVNPTLPNDFYLEEFQFNVSRIRKFLDSNFNHSSYYLEIKTIEEDIKKGLNVGVKKIVLQDSKIPLEKSIEFILKHYSRKSNYLKEYLELYYKHKNIDFEYGDTYL